MFDLRVNLGIKKQRRARLQRADLVKEQVKKVLEDANQKLILMVRG